MNLISRSHRAADSNCVWHGYVWYEIIGLFTLHFWNAAELEPPVCRFKQQFDNIYNALKHATDDKGSYQAGITAGCDIIIYTTSRMPCQRNNKTRVSESIRCIFKGIVKKQACLNQVQIKDDKQQIWKMTGQTLFPSHSRGPIRVLPAFWCKRPRCATPLN